MTILAANEPSPNQSQPATSSAGSPEASRKQTDRRRTPTGEADHFLLDKLYPDAHEVFRPTFILNPALDNVVVALDTNALLLPYSIGKGDLSALGEVYSKIAQSGRLFLPKRVAREFIKNRDGNLADLVQAIDDRISRMNSWDTRVGSLLLEGFDESEALSKASITLNEAAKSYLDILRRLSARIKAWRGDDPVTALYASIFNNELMIEPLEKNEEIVAELEYGLINKVPPGYKDAKKDDQGIGDVVIWLSLLNLGREKQKDLIFVTGEQKADWFVRSNKNPIYPRPELVDAYRRASGGHSLRLSSLHEFLREMAAPDKLVANVEVAENNANSVIQATSTSLVTPFASTRHASLLTSGLRFAGGGDPLPMGYKSFDYSSYNGLLQIEAGGYNFDIIFSKSSDTSIRLIKGGTTQRIARIKNQSNNVVTSIGSLDTTSDQYIINLGEGFIVQNEAGAILAGRINEIKDDSRGSDHDEVVFNYVISPPGSLIFIP